MKIRCFFLLCAAALGAAGQSARGAKPEPKPALAVSTRELLGRITADDLRGDLSFLASDALQGRFTPSPGLDVAAEFIASRFRAAGLEPAGDQEYFQTANMIDRRMPKMQSALKVIVGSQSVEAPADSIAVYAESAASHFENLPAVIFRSPDVEALKKTDVKGKAVIERQGNFAHLAHEERIAEYRKLRAFSRAVREAGAALEIVVSDAKTPAPQARLLSAEAAGKQETPILLAASSDLLKVIEQSDKAAVTVHIPAPDDRQVVGKNVIALLRGSDPVLKDTYVLLTAHYDHIGTVATAAGMTMAVELYR